MKLAILVTGGTFDKEYNKLTGKLYFKRTHIEEMLAMGRSRARIRIKVVMLKDSMQMTTMDRRRILRACKTADESRLIITHGTDTMEKTARFLAPKISGKTIVLTGAMIPYRLGSSDGMFNLGSSIALAQVLPPGVFVSMNGRCFKWDQVTKNRRRGYFKKIKPKPLHPAKRASKTAHT